MRNWMISWSVFLLVVTLPAAAAQAALIPIVLDPAQPVVVFDSNGVTTFTAADGHFAVTAEAIFLNDPGGDSGSFVPFGSLDIDLDLNSSCALINGSLELTGTVFLALSGVVDGTPPNPPLLTADAVDFGFDGSGASTDLYDAQFQITGGQLAGFWPGNTLGVQITSESSDFAGDCSVDFSGEAKGNLGGIEVETACELDLDKEGCVVQPPEPPGDDCDGRLTQMIFRYTGEGCDATSHLQHPKKVRCFGDADDTDPVDVLVYSLKRSWYGWWWRKTIFADVDDVPLGGEVTVDASAGGKTRLPRNLWIKFTDNGCQYLEKVKFHTSCSEPIGVGNQFGSALITSLTSTQGGTIVLDEDDEDDECIQEISLVPEPHCVGDIAKLTLRYVGGDCASGLNSQAPGAQECTDTALSPTSEAVRIKVKDHCTGCSHLYLDEQPLSVGDTITIDPAVLGQSTLTETTGFWIYEEDAAGGGLVQDGCFKTNCSEPLNLGDQFGALEVFAIETTTGLVASLGGEVEYTYTVTNPNASDATVTVDDDQLGNIVTDAEVPAGESVVWTETVFIDETTTNVATAMGTVNSLMCTPDDDTVTVTVEEPPDPGLVCAYNVKAMLLEWTGPDVASADVTLTASRFPLDPVVYDDIPLVNGETISKASEGGYTINAWKHGHRKKLGDSVEIVVEYDSTTITEVINTAAPYDDAFETNNPAPLVGGGTSPNWTVDDLVCKRPCGCPGHGDHDDDSDSDSDDSDSDSDSWHRCW